MTKCIQLSGQAELDPTTATLSTLVRLRDEDFAIVVGWLRGERGALAERDAANEKAVAAIVAEMMKGADERHAAMAAWSERNVPL